MAFWNQFKFKKKPFKDPSEEKREDLEIKKKIEASKEEVKKTVAKSAAKKELEKKNLSRGALVKEESKKVEKTQKAKTAKHKEDTGDAFRVLIRPVISEKVTKLGEIDQYVFEVAPRATKNEIKKAIKNVYGVMPIKIRIIKILGKRVRFGRNFGKLKDVKKAIITLKKGESIQIYEGV